MATNAELTKRVQEMEQKLDDISRAYYARLDKAEAELFRLVSVVDRLKAADAK